jgi:hypothetical protein
MKIKTSTVATITSRYEAVKSCLDEQTRRRFLAAEALSAGYGGIKTVAMATGHSTSMISNGVAELLNDKRPLFNRVRRVGAGRKPVTEVYPGILDALKALVEARLCGDPMSPMQWVSSSCRHLADALTAQGMKVTHTTVRMLLAQLGYTLQGCRKTLESKQHPDRNAQFEHIEKRIGEHRQSGDPLLSVDTKKRENRQLQQ